MVMFDLVRNYQRHACYGLVAVTLAAGLAIAAVPAAGAVSVQASGQHLIAAPHRLAGPHPMRVRVRGTSAAVITGALINHGGPVQSAPHVFVDFWGWTSDPSGEQPYLEHFLSSVGGTSWLATVSQYGGGWSGDLLAGTWSDPAAVPASPSDAQIQAEAQAAASHFGTGNSVNVQIVVATPTGHSTPGFGTSFCAYHGAVAADPNVTYTDLPYLTDAGSSCGEDLVNGSNGLLDGVSIVEGHELAEAITDPLLNAWFDANGNEIGDKCAWVNLADISTDGGSFAVQPLWSNAANGCALSSAIPVPPAPIAGFVKTANTSGTVEVHADTVSSGSYHRILDSTSDFTPSDRGNGTFQLFGNANGEPKLGFVKTANTGSGTVEVFVDTFSSGSYHRVLSTTSDFSPSDAANGTFQLFGNVNNEPELGFVKTANTGSGTVEVFVDTFSNGSYHRILNTTSDFSPSERSNGTFQLFGSVNNEPELGFVKTANTGSGTVEVFVDTFGSSYHRLLNTTSDFSPSDRSNGTFQLFGSVNNEPELGFVKTVNTSGTVEVHVDTFGGSYHRVLDSTSDFSPSDRTNGTFQLTVS